MHSLLPERFPVLSPMRPPVIGATVQVKGVTIGTTTDLNGMFSINLPANRKTLLFSYVGYEAQEIAVGRENYLNVALKQDANALDEVVVVGYGQQKKGMLKRLSEIFHK